MCMCHDMYVSGGQSTTCGDTLFLLPCGSWVPNTGDQAWWQLSHLISPVLNFLRQIGTREPSACWGCRYSSLCLKDFRIWMKWVWTTYSSGLSHALVPSAVPEVGNLTKIATWWKRDLVRLLFKGITVHHGGKSSQWCREGASVQSLPASWSAKKQSSAIGNRPNYIP